MRKAAFLALLLALVPLQAQALETNELLGLVAMPLAVAAASDVTGVPVGDLSHFVATLNRAQVPPTQVVQVVRYAPAALVVEVEQEQPTFIEYVDYEVDRGVTGSRLVTVIEDRYRTYDLEPQFIVMEEPATTYVVRDDYIPEYVVTRVAEYRPAYVVGDTNDLLALAAMPLAVAAVADIAGIPFSDLSSLVASLNAARMPPLQVVEVLRYSPVVMVDAYERPRFLQFVNTQVVSGVRGPRLIDSLDDRFVTYNVTPRFRTVRPTRVVNVIDDDDFFPPVVRTRVAEVRAHPHGGPPGQLKKERGLQTGAEVVHGTARRPATTVVRTAERDRAARASASRERAAERKVSQERSKRRSERRAAATERRADRGREAKRVAEPKGERPKTDRQIQQPKPDRAERGKGGGRSGNSQGKGKGKGKG
ncbi:MAG TPA: hypothetical protein VE974_26970 [Thermoanaerobaculia bacterium]|nr:hypothetical protein [Thermoanaerobaculia bacterium]